MRRISSPLNPLVKDIARETGGAPVHGPRRVVLEGLHLTVEGLQSGRIRVSHVFVLEAEQEQGKYGSVLSHPGIAGADIILSSDSVIRKLSSTTTPQGILCIGTIEAWGIEDLAGQAPGLVVVCDRIQDPGNLGTIIRTAVSAGAQGILLLPGTADPLSAKVLRSTAGSYFHLPVVRTEGYGELGLLKRRGHGLFGAQAHGGDPLFDTMFPERTALVFGNEGQGLSAEAAGWCDRFFTIPVRGRSESLNVASAAAVSIYEYVRQRDAG